MEWVKVTNLKNQTNPPPQKKNTKILLNEHHHHKGLASLLPSHFNNQIEPVIRTTSEGV